MTGALFGHDSVEVRKMSKQGMARPDWTHVRPKNREALVPEIQGKAKQGKTPAEPVIAGTEGGEQPKVFHQKKDG